MTGQVVSSQAYNDDQGQNPNEDPMESSNENTQMGEASQEEGSIAGEDHGEVEWEVLIYEMLQS